MLNIPFRLSLFLIFLVSNSLTAQINHNNGQISNFNLGIIDNVKNDVLSTYNVGKGFLESPLHFNTKDLLLGGIVVSGTVISFFADNAIRNNLGSFHNASLDNITSFGEKFGNPKYGTVLGGLLYAGGHVIGDKELRKTGLILIETVFINGLITQGLKTFLGRSRPYNNEGNYDLDFFEMEIDDEDHSLPSGHTSTAFAIATVLSNRIDNIYASVALYSFAGLTAYQRIYADKHWFSDLILGGALGTVVALKVIKLNSDEVPENDKIEMNIYPELNSHRYGINFNVKF